MPKRHHVAASSFVISQMHRPAPISGNAGTSGTRKPRSRSGCVRRRTITPALTIKNANSVPMFTSSASSLSGITAASAATTTPMMSVMTTGTRREFSRARPRGSSPSRAIANAIRVCP
jgi:hypothetical protein